MEGVPWPGRRRGRAGSGAAPLACIWPLLFFLLGGDARYAALAPASRPARRAPQLRWVPALTPAPSAWASPRKQEEQKLQRPAAYRPGERRARFSPPPLRRPWEAQPPLRVAAAHSPQKNASEEDCFFYLANPTHQGGAHEAHHRRFTHVYGLSAPVPNAGPGALPHHASPHRRCQRR